MKNIIGLLFIGYFIIIGLDMVWYSVIWLGNEGEIGTIRQYVSRKR